MKEMKKYSCALSTAAVILMLSGNSYASSCSESLIDSAATAFDNTYSTSSKSAVFSVCGYIVTVSSAYSENDWKTLST